MLLVLFIYILEILGGIFIVNVDIIFNFAASIAGSALAFFFPGAFYVALEKGNKLIEYSESPTKLKLIKISAYVYIVLGVISCVVLLVNNILSIVDP